MSRKQEPLTPLTTTRVWRDHIRKKLARPRCPDCSGRGWIATDQHRFLLRSEEADTLCDCACRTVFKICLARYHNCRSSQVSLKTGITEEIKGVLCSRSEEEYIADFERITLKVATARPEAKRFEILLKGFYWAGEPVKGGLSATDYKRTLDAFDSGLSALIGVAEGDLDLMKRLLTAVAGRALFECKPYSLYPPNAYIHAPIQRKWRR